MVLEDLRTIKQLATANPGVWTESSLRWLVFNSKENGLDQAIVKLGGRVLIDIRQFERWLDSQRLA